MISLI
jgi:hypothetical protein